jgi:quercetin dioxygenase-like cupin family protein
MTSTRLLSHELEEFPVKVRSLNSTALTIALAFSWSAAGDDRKDGHPADKDHVVVSADRIKWGPAPPSLPPGAQAALLAGDPTREGSVFTIRFKAPDGYKVPPHWHPADENVTVLKGSLLMGRGEKLDLAAAEEVPAGGFSHMPKGMRHFAVAKGETIIQVHGLGPWDVHYVNPSDDPRKKSGAR